jgi:hypothetical protein
MRVKGIEAVRAAAPAEGARRGEKNGPEQGRHGVSERRRAGGRGRWKRDRFNNDKNGGHCPTVRNPG